MKQNRYTVVFHTGQQVLVSAFCEKEAIILAQADQIKKGNAYNVSFVVCTDKEG